MTFEVTVIVTVKVTMKVKDLGEEEGMLLINSPMGPGDEMIFTGDQECSCIIVSSIWSVERKTYK